MTSYDTVITTLRPKLSVVVAVIVVELVSSIRILAAKSEEKPRKLMKVLLVLTELIVAVAVSVLFGFNIVPL